MPTVEINFPFSGRACACPVQPPWLLYTDCSCAQCLIVSVYLTSCMETEARIPEWSAGGLVFANVGGIRLFTFTLVWSTVFLLILAMYNRLLSPFASL